MSCLLRAQKCLAHSCAGQLPVSQSSTPGKRAADELQTGSAHPRPGSSQTSTRPLHSAPVMDGLCWVILLWTHVGNTALAELLPGLPPPQVWLLHMQTQGLGQKGRPGVLVLVRIPRGECPGREEMLFDGGMPSSTCTTSSQPASGGVQPPPPHPRAKEALPGSHKLSKSCVSRQCTSQSESHHAIRRPAEPVPSLPCSSQPVQFERLTRFSLEKGRQPEETGSTESPEVGCSWGKERVGHGLLVFQQPHTHTK